MEIWWHEPSNYLDIVMPDRWVWRYEGGIYSKWYKYRLDEDVLPHSLAEGWVKINEFTR